MSQVWEYIKIALMNIRSNKGRSFLTMLGIIIGISSVIMVISIGEGIKGGVNNELNAMAGGQLYIYSYGDNDEGISVEFTMDDAQAILEKVAHVKAVTPKWAIAVTGTGRKGSFQGTASFGTAGLEYSVNDPLVKGRYFTDNDYYAANQVCVITESSARLLFGTTDVVGMDVEFDVYGNTQEFTIVGVRQDTASALSGLMTMDTLTVEMPLSILTDVYGYEITMNDLLIISEGGEYSTQVAKDVVRLMENRHDVRGKEAIQVENFNDYLGQIGEILDMITVFIVFVAAISLLVGGIGVMNIMLVSVTERTREIGIRKSLGARTGSILLQFLSESAIITLMGGVIGIILGVLGAKGVCSLMDFTATISVKTVLGASLFSSAVGIFFGIYPARRAAKMSPIEALRHE